MKWSRLLLAASLLLAGVECASAKSVSAPNPALFAGCNMAALYDGSASGMTQIVASNRHAANLSVRLCDPGRGRLGQRRFRLRDRRNLRDGNDENHPRVSIHLQRRRYRRSPAGLYRAADRARQQRRVYQPERAASPCRRSSTTRNSDD